MANAPTQPAAPTPAEPNTHAGGLTPAQWAALATAHDDDWWLDLLMPALLTACMLTYAVRRMGLLDWLLA